ncbi:MAG: 2-hydroxyacid dehydrogenase [Gemmatimonadales bacterium]
MTDRVLIAEELRGLLGDAPVPGCDVEWIPADRPTPSGDYRAVVPLLSRRFGAGEFRALPGLEIVANCAVGYDNIDLAAARDAGVIVTNTPDVLTNATADLTWALILAVARRLREGQELIGAGAWTGWHPEQLLGLELDGSTLGIVGAGRIGQAVGRRALGFGVQLLYAEVTGSRPRFEAETGARRVELDELLAESDIVTVHVPSTPVTRGMFGAARFAQMKRGALFINTARGDVVDEWALAAALESGQLGGAGLDVFADEPNVPTALVTDSKVVTLPHIGSATTRTRRAMAELAVRNVRQVLEGGVPVSPVALPPQR